MKGIVIGFDPDSRTGAVTTDDGTRYDFTAADWHGGGRPRRGEAVDFLPQGSRAAHLYRIEPDYVAPSFVQFYFSPGGRISRSQYWLRFVLPFWLISLLLSLLQLFGQAGFSALSTIFSLLMLWPSIAVLIKRIHDRDKPGALVWALYAPLIVALVFTVVAIVAAVIDSDRTSWTFGVIAGVVWAAVIGVGIWFFVEFGCLRGTIGPNRYGPDPVRPPDAGLLLRAS